MNIKYLRYSVTIIIIATLIYYIILNHSDFNILINLETGEIIVSYLLYFCFLIVSCTQNFIIYNDKDLDKFEKVTFFKIFLLSRFLTKLIPQSGNIFMARELKDKFGLKYTNFIERILSLYLIDLIFVITLSSIILLVLDPDMIIGGYNVSTIVLTLLILGFSLLVILYNFRKFRVDNLILANISEMTTNVVKILKNYRLFFEILILGAFSFIIVNVIYATIISGLNMQVHIAIVVIFTILFRLSHIINVTPGNIGINEFIFAYIGDHLNIGFSNGMLICMIYRFIVFSSLVVYGITLGGFSLIKKGGK